jgi:hypothetical protein
MLINEILRKILLPVYPILATKFLLSKLAFVMGKMGVGSQIEE